MRAIIIFLILFSLKAHAIKFDCTLAGIPGNLQKGKCVPIDMTHFRQAKLVQCPKAAFVCHPALYGEKACISKRKPVPDELQQLKLCEAVGQSPELRGQRLVKGSAEYQQWADMIDEIKVLCDPDVGDARWKDRCQLLSTRLMTMEKVIDKKEGVEANKDSPAPVSVDAEGNVIIHVESFGGAQGLLKFAQKYLKKKSSLGQKESKDNTHDTQGKRDPLPPSKAEVKKARMEIWPLICSGEFKTLAIEDQKTLFELTYALFIKGEFSQENLVDQKNIFCFLKKEIEAHLEDEPNPERLLELVTKVPKNQKWDCQ